uniref:hypothetical protein n=1 Tax=uncultured Chryseobacterium sp. TaxID=259322 RepID=UPI0025EAF228
TGGQLARTTCNWQEKTVWVSCSEGLHDGSNFHQCYFVNHPSEGTPPRAYTVEEYVCLLETDQGPGGMDSGGGGGGSSGSGGGGGDTPSNPPCNGTGILTQPQQPGITDADGCSGIPTQPNLPDPRNNPCTKAQIPVNNINTLLHDSNISSEVNALENYAATNHYEYGASIINTGNSNVAQTPYTNNDPNNPEHVNITIPPVGNYVASVHTHPNHGAAPPSAKDLYTTLESARDYPSYQGSFVFSYNGSKYAFVVNDRAKAKAFLLAFPFANNTTNEGRIFNENSQVGRDFLEIYKHYTEGRLSSYSGVGQIDGLESAYTMIFEKYDIGITLAKTDNLGNLKPLRSIKFTHTVTASGGKQIIGYKAIECP